MKNTNSFYALKTHLRPLLFLFLVLSTLACEKERIDDKETMEDPNNTISENKVVVLYFFGSSCPNCIAAGPDKGKILLQKLLQRYSKKHVCCGRI
jgi:thiol-disulfide isomerase/thioredoxin